MTEQADAGLPSVAGAVAGAVAGHEPPAWEVDPLPPGGRTELEPLTAKGALPAVNGAHVPGMPPVSTSVPVPAEALGTNLPGVQLGQRPRRRGDNFGWPANAAPGKPEGEVDTRG